MPEFHIGVLLTRMLVAQRTVAIKGYHAITEKDPNLARREAALRDSAQAEVDSLYSEIVRVVSDLLAKQEEMAKDLDSMIKATGRYEDLLAIHHITDHDYEG